MVGMFYMCCIGIIIFWDDDDDVEMLTFLLVMVYIYVFVFCIMDNDNNDTIHSCYMYIYKLNVVYII